MSDPRRVRVACAGLLLATASLAVPTVTPLDAQDVAVWRQRERDAADATSRAWQALEAARVAEQSFDARLEAGGRTVRYSSANLPARDRAAIEEGLEQARASLIASFGDGALALIDTATWVADRDPSPFGPSDSGRSTRVSGIVP